jgi:hypothetical protein
VQPHAAARTLLFHTDAPIREDMSQHPRVTIGWAVAGLETAITKLGDGPAERRVRDQFHQLLLALERARLIGATDYVDDAAALRD